MFEMGAFSVIIFYVVSLWKVEVREIICSAVIAVLLFLFTLSETNEIVPFFLHVTDRKMGVCI